MTLQQQRTQEALRALPSAGWVGRRDRAVHVLSQMAGMSDEHIATLTAGDVVTGPHSLLRALVGVFVVGTRREPGDGLARSPFDGHDDTAAPGSSEAVEPATEGRAVERQSVTAR